MNSLSCAVDRTEYCRYDLTRNQIQVALTYQGALSTDTVTVNLQRITGYTDGNPHTLATQTLSCTTGQPQAVATFPLETIRETEPYNPPVQGPGSNLIAPASRDNQLYRGVAAQYQVQAVANTTGPQAVSPTFRITLIPSDELRQLWIQGVPLESLDVIAPLFQPQVVTGVRIDRVAQDALRGLYPLTLTVGSPNTLQWANGPPQVLSSSAQQVVVLPDASQETYVVCTVNPWMLPTASVTETILLGGQQFTDEALQQYVDYATHSLESAWYFFVEPHTSDTDPLISQEPYEILQARGSVPASYHVEHQEIPMTYVRPRDFAHWMSFNLPRRQIQAVYYLFGYFNQSQAVSIGRDWIVFDPVTGTLELVPDNGAIISWQFYGAAILQFFINYNTIPSFWHFGLASGLNTLHGEYQIVREAIAKQAASNILSAAGFSLSGGALTRSLSRDGVSESRTYAGKQAGAELRAQYEAWLVKNVRRIGQRYGGISMQFI